MNVLDQVENGILEQVQNRQSAKKTEKYVLAIESRRIASSILANHKDDETTPEMEQLISEGVAQWIGWDEAEPQVDPIAEMAKKNRIIK